MINRVSAVLFIFIILLGFATPAFCQKSAHVDVLKVISERVKVSRLRLQEEVKRVETRINKERTEIATLKQELKGTDANSRVYRIVQETISSREKKLAAEIKVEQKRLASQEADMYRQAYLELQNAVKQVAEKRGISVVSRLAPTAIDISQLDPSDTDAIKKTLTQQYIYGGVRIDITDDVQTVLNGGTLAKPVANATQISRKLPETTKSQQPVRRVTTTSRSPSKLSTTKPSFIFESYKALNFQEGLARRGDDYIDTRGNVVLKHVDRGIHAKGDWKALGSFSDGMASVTEYDYVGYIDRSGKLAVECKYYGGKEFSEGLAGVVFSKADYPEIDSKTCWGFINKRGEIVIRPQFQKIINNFADGVAIVLDKNNEIKCIDTRGQIIFDFKDAMIYYPFSDGLARVVFGKKGDSENWKSGYMNRQGRIVIPPNFSYSGDFSEGLAVVTVGAKVGFINKSGQFVVRPRWKSAYPYQHGRAMVMDEHDKWGIIDNRGNIIKSPRWDNVGAMGEPGSKRMFFEGMASIYHDGEWMHIDTDGNVAPWKWKRTGVSRSGVIWVKDENGYGYIRNPFYRPDAREAKRNVMIR